MQHHNSPTPKTKLFWVKLNWTTEMISSIGITEKTPFLPFPALSNFLDVVWLPHIRVEDRHLLHVLSQAGPPSCVPQWLPVELQ